MVPLITTTVIARRLEVFRNLGTICWYQCFRKFIREEAIAIASVHGIFPRLKITVAIHFVENEATASVNFPKWKTSTTQGGPAVGMCFKSINVVNSASVGDL